MPLRLGALHDALLHPGDAELAKKAAEELADYDSRLASMDTRLAVVQAMLAAVLGLCLLILGKVW
jgi:phage shock protein A